MRRQCTFDTNPTIPLHSRSKFGRLDEKMELGKEGEDGLVADQIGQAPDSRKLQMRLTVSTLLQIVRCTSPSTSSQ